MTARALISFCECNLIEFAQRPSALQTVSGKTDSGETVELDATHLIFGGL